MAACGAAAVVNNCIQIVQHRLGRRGDEEWAHIQRSERELNKGVNLLSEPPLDVQESFKMYNEHIGEAPQLQFLPCLRMQNRNEN